MLTKKVAGVLLLRASLYCTTERVHALTQQDWEDWMNAVITLDRARRLLYVRRAVKRGELVP